MLPYNHQYSKYIAYEIVPSNINDLPHSILQLLVGTAGDIKVTTFNGDIVTFKNATKINLYIKKIWETGTTASNIIGLYQPSLTLVNNTITPIPIINTGLTTDLPDGFYLNKDSKATLVDLDG